MEIVYNYAVFTGVQKNPTVLSAETFLTESNLLIKNYRDKDYIESLKLSELKTVIFGKFARSIAFHSLKQEAISRFFL